MEVVFSKYKNRWKKIMVILDLFRQKCYISKPRSRNKEEGLQKAMANFTLEIMKSQPDFSVGEKKPLQKQQEFDDSECSCCNGNKPAKI